jgi:hypothetical protein
MLAQGLALEFDRWTLLTLAVGVGVSALVFFVLRRSWVRRRRAAAFPAEGEMPWGELLRMLETHKRKPAAPGGAPAEELGPTAVIKLALSRPSAPSSAEPTTARDPKGRKGGAAENRTSARRWGNPTDVQLTLPSRARGQTGLLGLVINRSTGGLAIFVEEDVQPGTVVKVRPVEAPAYVQSVDIEVRYCHRISKSFVIGCQFRGAVPWNVRGWFG